MSEKKNAGICFSIPVLGVVIGACALVIAAFALLHMITFGHFSAALKNKDTQIDLIKERVAGLEKTVEENREKMLVQQQEIDRLRTLIDTLTGEAVPPPKPEPIVLRGAGSQRDETQLEAIPFAGTGELVVRARARRWADDTSIGLQIWDPVEDGLVFRGGYYRVVRGGKAVIDEPIPGWDQLKRGEHTFELSWNPRSLTFKVDGKPVAAIPSRVLPPRSTTFLIRLNADYDDTLTVRWYRARYTDASGRMITVP